MSKPHSCGALLVTHNNENKLGIILGMENGSYLPFKGCVNEIDIHRNKLSDATVDQLYQITASREVHEETCMLVEIPPVDIILQHNFSTNNKCYHIAAIYVPFGIIEKFEKARKSMIKEECKEKKNIKFFDLDTCLDSNEIHAITKRSIKYYYEGLKKIDKSHEYFKSISACKVNKYNANTNVSNVKNCHDQCKNTVYTQIKCQTPENSNKCLTPKNNKCPTQEIQQNIDFKRVLLYINDLYNTMSRL